LIRKEKKKFTDLEVDKLYVYSEDTSSVTMFKCFGIRGVNVIYQTVPIIPLSKMSFTVKR